ncbi:hypothetical protein AVEN_224125-1 [Araneus ventricosus]|uniref:Mutator-like transposase domain-containing protein n=1 Tax=Araneus ventricosus TaxID=182803 RepID=A0A4Y2DVG5_ARAVE|nr:hypothetical protein AVEN_224125-1 [Araneus ventricosus]
MSGVKRKRNVLNVKQKLEILQKLDNGESASTYAEDVLNEGNTISHSDALQSVETLLDCMGQKGFDYGDITAAAIVGLESKKVLFVGVRNKYCVICARAKSKGLKPDEHKCFRNWMGSSSAMEADIIVDGFTKSVEMHGVKYARFIGDGDSNVYKKILDSMPYDNLTVEKIECKNHLLRNMCNKLKDIARNGKIGHVTLRKLIGSRVLRIRTAVTMAIKYRKEEPSKTENDKIMSLRQDIMNVPFHVFGIHENCEPYFCRDKKDKNYVTVLKTSGLLCRLLDVLNSLSDHARSLIKDVSSNKVEEFNSIVSKFIGGKRINYCLKRSYQARCCAAVVAHNSKTPVYKLHRSMYNCSPGGVSKRSEERKAARRARDSLRKKNCTRKRLFSPVDAVSYGSNAQKPDLDSETFKIKKEKFINNLAVSKEKAHRILMETALQSLSHLWIEERRKRLTASNFGFVCNRLPHTKCDNIVKKILYSNFESSGMKYGKKHEKML